MPQETTEVQEQVILASTGQPFKSKAAASAAIASKNLDESFYETFEISPKSWVIRVKDKKNSYVESYFRVKFHDKSHPNDPIDVMLAVNGETLILKRQCEVVLPNRFIEAAKNAEYIHFEQLPGVSRKVTANIRMFPFDMLGEATEEDFVKQKRDGTKKTLANIKKYGFDGSPDD